MNAKELINIKKYKIIQDRTIYYTASYQMYRVECFPMHMYFIDYYGR